MVDGRVAGVDRVGCGVVCGGVHLFGGVFGLDGEGGLGKVCGSFFLGGGCTRSFCVAERALYLYLYSGFFVVVGIFQLYTLRDWISSDELVSRSMQNI